MVPWRLPLECLGAEVQWRHVHFQASHAHGAGGVQRKRRQFSFYKQRSSSVFKGLVGLLAFVPIAFVISREPA